jgi:serine/threonine protein kinase
MNAATLKRPMVLPRDVVLVPEADLPDDLRQGLRAEPYDVAVTRPRSREPSRLVDADGAALLAHFRVPTTIVESVIAFSRHRRLDPEETLERSYPMFQSLLFSRLLVPADSPEAERIEPEFRVGSRLPVGTVARCVHVLDDVELYQLRLADGSTAALKIIRPGVATDAGAAVGREAACLERLDGSVNPPFLGKGAIDGRPYVLTAWCPGVTANVVADELRRLPDGRGRLLRLCVAIAAAYARLHAQGVVHADVHPRNVLVGRSGRATIIDYGLTRIQGGGADLDHGARAGVAQFLEPEYAEAMLARRRPPRASFAGEQYGLGALLYYLIVGEHYCRFEPEREALLRQIVGGRVCAFRDHGAAPWPEIEHILQVALAKQPQARFPSVAELAAALGRVDAVPVEEERQDPVRRAPRSVGARLLADVLRQTSIDSQALASGPPSGPRCSLNNGAAGIAYMLHRLAAARDDPALLSLADLWISKALDEKGRDDAFCDVRLDLTPEVIGKVSPFHTVSGVHAVQAMVAHARGDADTEARAMADFVASVDVPSAGVDLTLGRAGVLLACAALVEQSGHDAALRARGDALADAASSATDLPFLGIAHGVAGVTYACLRWSQATGRPVPSPAIDRLDELAARGDEIGRGMRWPILARDDRGESSLSAGWCHGSAGYVFLWTLAYDVLGREGHLRLAESAAWNVWESRHPTSSLCCGLAGQAYALLSWYRRSGESDWLDRAGALAERAASAALAGDGPPYSLYKGRVGVGLLAAEVTEPESARMPFFESERQVERRPARSVVPRSPQSVPGPDAARRPAANT